MKKIFFLLCCVLIPFLPVHAQTVQPETPVFENEDVTVSLLEDQVWVFETADKTTMYLIEGTERALLFDTGTYVRDLKRIVQSITDKPLYVVLSHCHYDHAGGVGYFPEIYMHPADTVLLNRMPPYGGTIRYMRGGDVFDLGDRQLEVVEMPAHTPGSIVLMDWTEGICYSGDAFGSGQVWLQVEPTMPLSVYRATLRRMQAAAARGITKIYCGHYPHLRRPLERTYLDDMETCARLIAEGTPEADRPFDVQVAIGCPHPRIATWGSASIVYDPAQARK